LSKAQRIAAVCLVALAAACLPAGAQDRQLQVAPSKPAPAGERRVALVIGNSAYKSSPLRNPVNDARAISKALSATGFKVTVLENATLTTMRRAVRAFGDDLVAGGVGLFYYAGHGMQVRGRNFLIPVNADIEREDEVEDGALDANFVLSKMDSAKNALNLIILDACRNNPFARSFRSGSQGLAQMDAPSGTLVAFATAPGSVASDGEGENGLYTKHLLANIGKPGLPIEQVFKEVRRGVGRETNDRQIPWESSSLRGDFFFTAPDPSLSGAAQKQQLESAVAEAVRREQEKLAIQQAQMQRMIQDMLAKQRAELEEEMRRRVERAKALAPEPAAIEAASPRPPEIQLSTVSAAPGRAPTPPENPRLPKEGDTWDYIFVDTAQRRERGIRVEVLGASAEGVLEHADLPGRAETRVHAPGPQLTMEPPLWEFSPYLLAFGDAKADSRWPSISVLRERTCSHQITCNYSGRVAGEEKVTTRAGTFDAVKVVVELYGPVQSNQQLVRVATFWYAETAKRVVKAQLRTLSGVFSFDPDYDLELLSYKLN
jgi:uncharacterized caspase-like protein